MDILKGKPKSSGLHYAAFSSDNVCQRNLHLVGKAPWRCCSQLGGTSAHLQAWVWAGCSSRRQLGKGQGPAQVQFLQISVQGRKGEADFPCGCCGFFGSSLRKGWTL